MVELTDIQVVALTGVDQVAMVIHQEGQAVDLISVMEDIHPENQVVTTVVTEMETTEAMVTEDIHPEVVVMPQPTEDTNTKYLSRCSDIYCVYYKKGIHRATFIITHRIVSVWNRRNAALIANDNNNFNTIEFSYGCLMYFIALGHFQLNYHRVKKTIIRITLKTNKFLR
ncbi:hypothetical protein ANTRET_LOCUS8337 [Anthophora retusa]